MCPTTEVATDQLWKYQLRREHSVLLEQNQTTLEQNKLLKRSLTDLETQLCTTQASVDHKIDVIQSAIEDHRHAMCVLQDRYTAAELVLEKLVASIGEIQATNSNTHVDILPSMPELELLKTELRALTLRLEEVEGRVDTASKVNQIDLGIAVPMTASHDQAARKPANSAKTPTSRNRAGAQSSTDAAPRSQNVANSGVRKSRRQQHKSPSSPVAPTPSYARLPNPPIAQNDANLNDYIALVDEISKTLAPGDLKPLAAAFITGLEDMDEQDMIVNDLLKRQLAENWEEGEIVMRCNWNDIRQVLGDLGISVPNVVPENKGERKSEENSTKKPKR